MCSAHGLVAEMFPDIDTAATKEQYANAVNFHSTTSKEEYLFTGVHYRRLATFLQSSVPGHKPSDGQDHAFIIAQTYSPNTVVNIEEYYDPSSFQSSMNAKPIDPSSCQLLFLRGFPSADWLNVLGATYRLDPEFVRRHLDFMQPSEYYDLPSLPSSASNMFRLKLNTICKRDEVIGFGDVEKDRREEVGEVTKHQRLLGLAGVLGESIVRRYANHDEMTYSLEQDVSCYVTRKNGHTVGMSLSAVLKAFSQSLTTFNSAHMAGYRKESSVWSMWPLAFFEDQTGLSPEHMPTYHTASIERCASPIRRDGKSSAYFAYRP